MSRGRGYTGLGHPMNLPPAVLLAFLAAAPALGASRPREGTPSRLSAADQGFLRDHGWEPDVVSPAAFYAVEGGPEAFLRANRGAYDRFIAWRHDAPRMLRAERKERGSVEKDLRRMDGFILPGPMAPLWSNLKLAPHGVNADVPESAGFEPDRGGGAPSDGQGVDAAGAGRSEAGPPPATPGLHTQPAPPPGGKGPKPATEVPGTLDGAIDWICSYVPCSKA